MLWLWVLLLGGCGLFGDQPPPPTVANLTLVAATDVNPDADGRASPLVVRVYALNAPGRFETADFLALYRDDQATLGDTLVERRELTLTPGQARQAVYTLPDEGGWLGVAAQYRQLEETGWRALLPIPAHRTTKAVVHLDRSRASFAVAE